MYDTLIQAMKDEKGEGAIMEWRTLRIHDNSMRISSSTNQRTLSSKTGEVLKRYIALLIIWNQYYFPAFDGCSMVTSVSLEEKLGEGTRETLNSFHVTAFL
jgi:exopolysaccharide biosynthesis protein